MITLTYNHRTSDPPNLLQIISAFYVYKQQGLENALSLYPFTKEFIEQNANKSFEVVKKELITEMQKSIQFNKRANKAA
jgi:hypothetical protein